MQTILTRAVSMGSQVFLARLLLPEHFTLAMLAQSMGPFLGLVQPPLNELLIQRQDKFNRWANSAFWLSVVTSFSALALSFLLAPIGALIYQSFTVGILILIMGLTSLLNGLSAIGMARQTIDYQFRRIAAISAAVSISANLLMVLLAWLGAGAFSLIVPLTASAALNLFLFSRLSDFRPRLPIQMKRWKPLLHDGMLLAACGFATAVTMQADNFSLGLFKKEEMGYYVWGYALSMQFVQLIAGSLRGALLPAFSGISSERNRYDDAVLDALRLISFIAMPACILMIPVIPSVVMNVFSSRWQNAIPLVQIFLPSMGFVVASTVAVTAMQSRGLYRRFFFIQCIIASIFVATVLPAAAFSGPKAVAMAVTVIYALSGPVYAIMATTPSPFTYKGKILGAMLVPSSVAVLSAWAGWYVASLSKLDSVQGAYGLLSLSLGMACYLVIAIFVMPARLRSAYDRLRLLRARIPRFNPSRLPETAGKEH